MAVQLTMYGDRHMTPITGEPMPDGTVENACSGGLWRVDHESGPWQIITPTDGPNGGSFTDRDGWPLIIACYSFGTVSLVKS